MKGSAQLILAGLMTLSLNSSFASCYNNYVEKRNEVEEIIKNSNIKQATVEASALFISTNVVVIAALSAAGAGGVLPSTVGGGGMVSAALIAEKYLDIRMDDDAKEALQKRALLDASLGLLKEARIGQGPHLAQALMVINQNVSTAISMKNLADTIVGQDDAETYCQSERILSPAGIISMATEELKQNL